MEEKKVKAGNLGFGICLFIIAVLLIVIGFIIYDSKIQKDDMDAKASELEQTIKEKDDKITELDGKISKVSEALGTEKESNAENKNKVNKDKNTVNNLSSINKRLYSVDSGLNPQRYFLLVDDITYGMDQNFLDKKTYILDLDLSDENEMVKEIDLAKLFKPIFDKYIEKNKGDNKGEFSVEYFGYSTTEFDIDFENEVPFVGYYRCVNGNTETSLGYELYVYNVEKQQIRDLGNYN